MILSKRIMAVSCAVAVLSIPGPGLCGGDTARSWNNTWSGGVGKASPAGGRDGDALGRGEHLRISYPLQDSVFPPDGVSPVIRWSSPSVAAGDARRWRLVVSADGVREEHLCSGGKWKIPPGLWSKLLKLAPGTRIKIDLSAVVREGRKMAEDGAGTALSKGASVCFSISADPVEAPIFYREVPLPFIDAVKDTTKIRWRFGAVSSEKRPPVILDKLPVCGNCHSFTRDGKYMGMDVDYANDKGSYVITKLEKQITLAKSKIITWSSYKSFDGEPTFGLLSQISPDGRYVVSMVKDRSVFVPAPDLAYSQLFFPIKGILVVYDRKEKTFKALPGADDPAFVQGNPTWSPDGKFIVFARARAYDMSKLKATQALSVLLKPEECSQFLSREELFRFDLYRIPFNDGKGGRPEPLEGASANGKSNYFARYSPDGKWIVFCMADSFMLLQPDARLYAIPSGGGKARLLACNTDSMNSWHSFSPNGRWMVFSSKLNGPFTQLLLTHFDSEGQTTRPVVLEQFTGADRAANIPEFVNAAPDAIVRIKEKFVDDNSYVRAAYEYRRQGDIDGAVKYLRKALSFNSDNERARDTLGELLLRKGRNEEALIHLERAHEANPTDPELNTRLGYAYLNRGRYFDAISCFSSAVDVDSVPVMALCGWGSALSKQGLYKQAEGLLKRALALKPVKFEPNFRLGLNYMRWNKPDKAVPYLESALKLEPGDLSARLALVQMLMSKNRMTRAEELIEKGLELHEASPALHVFKGKILASRDDLDGAEKEFLKVLKHRPGNAEALSELSVVKARRGDMKAALSLGIKAVKSGPDNVNAHFVLAQHLFRTGRIDKAVEELKELLLLKPDDAPSHDFLGYLLMKKGEYQSARLHFMEAVKAEPKNRRYQFNLRKAVAKIRLNKRYHPKKTR